ncbi:DpnI domain-containing protein [Pectinatus sottacetonis]|uniref:DpnI domain-containing protein n=1 Tax=Pectinatus sottacetonis TaxID=1002795 RepID=UPI001E5CF8CC|nr:DpnI domain-containing protein [Pectinatus sottacetonis]
MDTTLAKKYKSNTQKARVITEKWTHDNIYCIRCGNKKIEKYENNKPVADFYCPHCKSEYELKSHAGLFRKKIVDGAYDTMITRITSNNNPDLFGMEYNHVNYCIDNFFVIPKYFFTVDIIEKRKPLGPMARRAGWVGCNILLTEIPSNGCIYLIRHGKEIDYQLVINKLQRANFLEEKNIAKRGWLMDVLRCVDKIKTNEFTLSDIYNFEDELHARHLGNQHIRDKIRQQLQVLRDRGYIEFLSRGHYRKID